jgi:YidC/Oxa1 family membrane protein insertase
LIHLFATIGLGPLQEAIKRTLYGIHDHTPLSWAWSIIALTVIVRIILVPLTVKQTRSMQAMQRLQPEMKKLQEKYKNDRQKLNQEMMAFYKENKVNPFGSCLPLVLQLPIFFSLFLVLRQFSSQANKESLGDLSFLGGFIPDITVHTSAAGAAGWVLIVIYVLSQLGSSLLMPTTVDKTQRYLFMAMPFFFVIFVVNFPVGLMLYWITTNLWTVGQTAIIRKTMPMPKPPPGATPTSLFPKRTPKPEQPPKSGGTPAKPSSRTPRGGTPKPKPASGPATPPKSSGGRPAGGSRPPQRGGKRRR